MESLCTINAREFEATLKALEQKQFRYATAVALTRVGQKVKNAIRGTMQVSFDRPTPYTLNSLVLIPATVTSLSAEVRIKDRGTGGLPQSVFLQPEVQGGDRQSKGSERAFRSKGVLPGGMFWVPGAGAKLDQYGNMSRGQVLQIVSAVRELGAGAAGAPTRKNKRTAKLAASIFIGKPAGGRLPLGVYQRGADGSLKPLMIFVSEPHYKVRLPFTEIAATVYATNFENEFSQALADALNSAK